jgi:gamma-glutamyl:cysteine ligase YbdK (ATP-grasp superfamily)
MTDKLPGEEWKAYQRRTGGDYTTWRCQVEVEADAKIDAVRESMTPEERAAASARGIEAVREILGEWNDIRAQLKD